MKLRFKVLTAAGALLSTAAAVYWLLPLCAPLPQLTPPGDARVLDRHGALLGYVPGEDGYRCQPLEELPTQLVRALLAAEDKRFYSHGGVDALALLRATWQQLSGQGKSGASTISMQVAKMYSPPAPRNLRSKLREMLQARRLEMAYSKEELLRAYLNRADFSNMCRGAETAARFYFGKGAGELTAPEAALLVALVKSPTQLNPVRHPQAALKRRNLILLRMGEGIAAPPGVQPRSINAPAAAGGAPGQLTLDATLQSRCATIALEEVERLQSRNVSQAAVVVADNRTGEVLVALPAACPESERGGALDGTVTPRSAGSTLKPFVYLMAFRHGAWPGTVLPDVPTLYRSADGVQAPGNYEEHYMGPISIRQALACSQNIPAMEALNRYGSVQECMELLRVLGFELPGTAQHFGLGLAIGNAHITLREMVQAYSVLARQGTMLPLQTRLPLREEKPVELLPLHDCYRLADVLSDTDARVPSFGSAPNLRFPFRVAAKTGTSSNFRDNWCVGFTAEYTVGVWVGNFDQSPMQEISGVSGAGPIFHRVFELLHRDTPATFPEMPDSLRRVEIDRRTGSLATPATPPTCRRSELATAADLQRLPRGNFDADGRAILDSRYAEWYGTSPLKHLYALADAQADTRPPAILIPANGSTLTLEPTLPHSGALVELKSTLPPATTTWHSPTLRVERRNGKWYAHLKPGIHTLYATAPPHSAAESTFRVQVNAK
ncbi:MAG: transglycosylase domain-containing protein [Akkermansia sp.]|nr:transglycosylase domain-containing protein [Akkermansia sp.]